MAQAYAEQVLSCQNEAEDLLDGMFRWGFDPDCSASEESDEWQLNTMFDTEEDILDLWAEIKKEHVRAVSEIAPFMTTAFPAFRADITLRPPRRTSLSAHLEDVVSKDFPLDSFKQKICDFLMGLLSAHPEPLLTQLENGKVEGLSAKTTATLKLKAGFV
ncbi:MAG: hypothetical protein Q9183_000075 [Haloplaca sp. 2 TL-2023]